jgi:hypothetical protein
MKYLIIISFVLICIASSFWGCQKEDLGNLDGIFSDTAQAGPVSQMTAKINDVPWSATSYNLTLTPGNPGQIILTGQSDNGQIITLVVSNSKAGDYLLSTSHVATYSPDTTNKTVYYSDISKITGGIINIDTVDTANEVMTGEFNFIGGLSNGATVNVSNGSFINLGYTNTASNVQFGAKVNGKSWNPIKVTANEAVATNILTITAVNANGQKMMLNFPASIKARKISYPLTSSGTYTASFQDGAYTLVPDSGSVHNVKPKLACSMKITSNSTTTMPRNIKGTFSFYAVPSDDLNAAGSRIASGVFNVNY